MSKFVVRTWDVDGMSTKRFASRKGALARFESMLGLTVEQAIDECFHMRAPADRPTRETVQFVEYVSMYGTRVAFREEGGAK